LERELPGLVLWLMGSFATATMVKVALALGPVVLGLAAAAKPKPTVRVPG